MKAVETKNLTVKYGEIEALNDITLNIEEGDYVGIVGPNGSGKTTLIRAVLGLIGSRMGDVLIFGKKIDDFHEWSRIGYLEQKLAFLGAHFPATVKEVIASGLISQKKYPRSFNKKDLAQVDAIAESLGITGLKARPIGKLSGGQQQRVLLARALVHKPDMLVLDEPTVALDPDSRENFYNTISKLNREKKMTVLLVSHDMGSIGKYASRLIYLDGKLIFSGGFDDFCNSSSMTDIFGLSSQHIICHRH